jgi:phospholipase/carboxylesterase
MTTHTLTELQTDSASGLHYRLRLPAPSQPTRLLVLLHGVGGNETNLLNLAEGVDAGTLVVLARGPQQLGAQQFAWFQVRFTATGPQISPEQAESSRTQLLALLQQLQQDYAIAAANTVIAGFSQGGIMSASVGLSAPHSVQGFGLLSGRILPELAPHIAAKAQLAGLRAWLSHGELDATLPVHWAQRAHALLTELGVAHALRLYPMDHGISAAMQADFVAWLAQ